MMFSQATQTVTERCSLPLATIQTDAGLFGKPPTRTRTRQQWQLGGNSNRANSGKPGLCKQFLFLIPKIFPQYFLPFWQFFYLIIIYFFLRAIVRSGPNTQHCPLSVWFLVAAGSTDHRWPSTLQSYQNRCKSGANAY